MGRDLERFDRAYLAEHVSRPNGSVAAMRASTVEKLLAFNQDTIAELSEPEAFLARLDRSWCRALPAARVSSVPTTG